MWKSRFNARNHCPVFRTNRLKNPVTGRKIAEGSPTQKWLITMCRAGAAGGAPASNISDFMRTRGRMALGKLIDEIIRQEGGRFIPDLKLSFETAYRGAVGAELQTMIMRLGGRNFKMSVTGPLATRLRELPADTPAIPDVPRVEQRDFCQAPAIQALDDRPPFMPQGHQMRAAEFMRAPGARLLLEHGLGSGKTCTSAMIISDYIQRHPDRLVYFFSPGNLRDNFIAEFCSFCPVDRRRLADGQYKNIRFFSLDDGTLRRKLPGAFRRCLVVVDEAQSLISSVRRGGVQAEDDVMKNLAVLFRRLTVDAPETSLLMLSGTPMPDSLAQHYNCLTLLKPHVMAGITYEEFEGMFTIRDDQYVFGDRVAELYRGCISYYKSPPEDVARVFYSDQTIDLGGSPLATAIIDALDKENYYRIMGLDTLVNAYRRRGMTAEAARSLAKLNKIRAATRDLSRRLSNVIYPQQVGNIEEGVAEEDDMDDRLMRQIAGDVDGFLEENAPKLALLIRNIRDERLCPGKQIIYCPFKAMSGVNLISRLLTHKGITNVVYSGDVSMVQRQEILRTYNSAENDQGVNTRVFLFTDAAAEGISLFSIRGVHIVNEDVFASHMRQVIGRAVRYKSHERLPEDQRVVNVFRYRVKAGELSPDQMNYDQGVRRETLLLNVQHKLHTEWSI